MPDLFKTRAQLGTRALQKLLVIGSGQSPEDEDTQLVDSIIDTTLADLSARGIVTVTNDEEIELPVFEWIADCLADNCANDFGKERNPQKVIYAESRLRVIGATQPSYEVLKSEYF